MSRTSRPGQRSRLLRPLTDFLHAESAGGYVLVAATAVALALASSPWRHAVESLWDTVVWISWGSHALALSLKEWVNDGLMTIFFFVVGLEIKRELVDGELRGRRRAALPMVAAAGGMLVPALLYRAINTGGAGAHGWGIPMATDIAMAVSVVALAGTSRLKSLGVFLLALAIVDDIGAIVVIAVFYTTGAEGRWLAIAAACVAVIVIARIGRINRVAAYVVAGVALWFSLHEAHVHPTLAGVICGLLAPTAPYRPADLIDADALADVSSVDAARETMQIARESVSVVEWLEHVLHPWSTFLVVPLFALANAGIALDTASLHDALTSRITIGVVVGLVVGKPLGIVSFVWLATQAGLTSRPAGLSWAHLTAAGMVAGIGFTVSLFIADLAFKHTASGEGLTGEAKIGILVASLVSAIAGLITLRASGRSTVDQAAGARDAT